MKTSHFHRMVNLSSLKTVNLLATRFSSQNRFFLIKNICKLDRNKWKQIKKLTLKIKGEFRTKTIFQTGFASTLKKVRRRGSTAGVKYLDRRTPFVTFRFADFFHSINSLIYSHSTERYFFRNDGHVLNARKTL